ncbi:hypothetical protein FIE12Z_12217 [Fusarium flagelliforme]|uniref:Uncharacterized protein n=2 Tax=Fusarium flagelliforme TaxID=2675880 RepID=A0A395M8E5_9HYPO|nr:hypothetical protein FIE12Z_12217 [Fusarium flagelliforme]
MAAARALVASGNVTGIDHETFGPNERMQAPIFGRVILTQQDVPENFITLKKGWGGECRVEITLTARLLAQQRVLVTVNGKLFEGTDESTGDLEDEQNASAVVPRGGIPVPFSMSLYSSGVGGGDSATVSLSFTNTVVED